MSNSGILRLFVMIGFFAIAATAGAMSRPVYAQCGSVTDAQILADVYAGIKADTGLAQQASHVNVVVTNSVVKFYGWADSQKDQEDIVDIAMNMKCVRMVNANKLQETPPPAGDALRSVNGCSSGTKPCGDVCIPDGDSCNIGGKP